MVEKAGLYVEPVQLQVVCRDLWTKLPPAAATIEATDIEEVGDVDTALGNYYATEVAGIARNLNMAEGVIRCWCGRKLITEQGIRSQVMRGQGESQGLANPAIQALVDAHL